VQASKRDARQREISGIAELNSALAREQALFGEELQLQARQLERQQYLLDSAAISTASYEQSKGSYLQYQRQYEGMASAMITNDIRVAQLHANGLAVEAEYSQQLEATAAAMMQSMALLRAALHAWEQRYFVKAAAGGVLSLSTELPINTFLKAGSRVGHILPVQAGGMLARIEVPVRSSGKIALGQAVVLKLPAYPYKEFGMLQTHIVRISAMTRQQADGRQYYVLEGPLSQPLTSTYGHALPYKPNMAVAAEIISENYSLLQRIFHQFSAVHNH